MPQSLTGDETPSRAVKGTGRRRIGESVARKEDDRFIRGVGQYSDDLNKPGQCYAVFVRSPVPHGIIRKIDTEAARRSDGVIAVLTGRDYVDDGYGPVVHRAIEGDPADFRTPAFGDGDPVALQFNQWPLPFEKVHHVGEPVAIVIGRSPAEAEDAAERIVLDIEPLPAAVTVGQSAEADAPQVNAEAPGNLCVHQLRGDAQAVAEALEKSDEIISGTFNVSRIAGGQMEPRSGIAEYDEENEQFVITAGNQGVHRYRDMIASALKVDNQRVRVICPDVGGGFGPRGHVNPEFVALAWVAHRLRRPVKWTNTRSGSFISDWQGRDMVLDGELGIMRDGRISAYRLRMRGNIGAHTICYAPPANAARLVTTVYDIEAACQELQVYLTHTLPVLPYRAAGRPEVHYVLERLVDMAARRIGLDRLHCRARNLIGQDRMPYTTAMGLTYDDCAFDEALQKAASLCDWAGFEARRTEAQQRDRLRGIAIVPFIESPVGAPFEMARLEIRTDGETCIYAGTQNHGQGHESSYAQVVSDLLGIPYEKISLAPGDTNELPIGGGTHSDRSMRMMGTLLHRISADIVDRTRPVAARLLQAEEEAVTFSDGSFCIDGAGDAKQEVSILDIAAVLHEFPEFQTSGPGNGAACLVSTAEQKGRINTYPYGAAAAEVEIDPETGELTLCRFCIANDCGVAVNPMIVHGQVHGGIVQGVGQTLGENVVYDFDTGQVLTGSFMDYMMPRADQFPPFELDEVAGPATMPPDNNPLGIKAGGEAGTVPALAVMGNAVMDALSELGIDHVDMPFTAANIWTAIQRAKPADA
jgi:aerobic carbon-monoxide dehydrogenase large subunit